MGLGFTGTLVVMGSIRELLGAGTLFGKNVVVHKDHAKKDHCKLCRHYASPPCAFSEHLPPHTAAEGQPSQPMLRCLRLSVLISIQMTSAISTPNTIFVMALATSVTWPIYTFLLVPNGLAYLQTIVFILVIAVLVQLVEITLKKYIPSLYKALGIYLPLITTNCAVLGVCISNIDNYLVEQAGSPGRRSPG